MLTGKTGNLGVMGWPIAHSLSPAMQNAALAKAGIDYVYTALPVEPVHLAAAVAGLRALRFRGWNVTIPHKQAMIDLLDEIDEDAQIIGAVNTVVQENGRLMGFNTDVAGFLAGLAGAGFSLAQKRVVLLGAGGAARAVLWGLIKSGASRVTIGVRHPEKAEMLRQAFAPKASTLGTELAVYHWEEERFHAELAQAALLVNTTPLGMAPRTEAAPPIDWEQVQRSAFVYDIIYTPRQTRFLREAAEHGHPTLNGEDMLVGQGAEAFRLWFGQEPDRALMKETLRAQLTAQE